MPEYIPDGDTNELIRELNAASDSPDADAGDSLPSGLQRIHPWLEELVERNASDLHLIAGRPPAFRVDGEIVTFGGTVTQSMLAEVLGGNERNILRTLGGSGSADRSYTAEIDGERRRFRANIHRERDRLAIAIRALPTSIPSFADLGLPSGIETLAERRRGLVLLCGPTGSGKTTTLAALVDAMNRTRHIHIVTLEDPIEYEHRDRESLVEQIEVGRDTPDFATGLRAALRQDPDVILVGEMRDHETISIALTAAETGHLILSTLHTGDAEQAIHRMVDVFPAAQQAQIRHQLAISLEAIVVQQLIPRATSAGRVAAVEILQANQPVRAHIRRDQIHNLANELTLGRKEGMLPMEESLAELVRSGAITREEAERRSRRPEDLVGRL